MIEPAGIKIVTPATVELQRKQNYTVHRESSGYKPQNAYLYRVMSPAVHGNLLLGGLIGLSTDIDNGAAFELIPDPLDITLEPLPQGSSPNAASQAPTDAAPPIAEYQTLPDPAPPRENLRQLPVYGVDSAKSGARLAPGSRFDTMRPSSFRTNNVRNWRSGVLTFVASRGSRPTDSHELPDVRWAGSNWTPEPRSTAA